jgi:hypothetical protein
MVFILLVVVGRVGAVFIALASIPSSATLSARNFLWQGTHPLCSGQLRIHSGRKGESRDQQSDVVFIIWHFKQVLPIRSP